MNSLRTDFGWAPHRTELCPKKLFLWDYLKDKVCSGRPRTIEKLREFIREEIRAIPLSVCSDVMNNFVQRLKKCTERNGGHLGHML